MNMQNLNNEELFQRHRKGKIYGGVIVLIVGLLLLLNQSGLPMPSWLFTWPMFLIVLGIYIGAKHQFRKPGWIVLCLIGSVFLLDSFVEGVNISHYFWPIFIIGIGLYMIVSHNKRKGDHRHAWEFNNTPTATNIGSDETHAAPGKEDYLDFVAIFGGIEKKVISKNFQGGDIVCIFSGAELNLTQAEIKGKVILELTNIFGGTKLLVPANWEIKSEIVAIFGGIEDKRMQQADMPTGENVLILRGTTILGGIEIKSF